MMTPVEQLRNAAVESRRILEWIVEWEMNESRRERIVEVIENNRRAVDRYDDSINGETPR